MLSNSRIYVFNIYYKNSNWLDILAANELSGLIATIFKIAVPDLSYKNMQFINSYKNEKTNCEIHFNKLKYQDRRILTKEDIKELRTILHTQLNSLKNLKYEQIHIVNDEFSTKPSIGFIKEDMLYV